VVEVVLVVALIMLVERVAVEVEEFAPLPVLVSLLETLSL
tara:strand:- start:359 stop:478 length:120 start_codon:yes stop_codon:yes gene_type:complete